MNRSGFSLVETLIYASLLAALCIVAFSWMNNSIQSFAKINKRSQQVMMAQTILSRLACDIQMAEASASRWLSDGNELRLYHNNRLISWRQEKDKIYRIENRSKALIGTQVVQFSHKLLMQNNQTNAVECRLTCADTSFNQTIRVYNG
jgi:Tfp pilus assembly protein PilV